MTIPVYYDLGWNYFYAADSPARRREYGMFRRCLPQLIDKSSMVGDLSGKWVIFQNGWLADFQGWACGEDAVDWARHLFKDSPDKAWIVACVDVELHKLSPLEMLGNAIADAELDPDVNE